MVAMKFCTVAFLFCFLISAKAQFGGYSTDKPFLASVGNSDPFCCFCSDKTPYLILQNFECPVTGYDHAETWTTNHTGGVITPVYTTTVLQGVQSLFIGCTNNSAETLGPAFTSLDEVWVYFLFRPVVLPPPTFKNIFQFKSPADTGIAQIGINSSGTLRIALNTAASTADAVSINTTYHVWGHYKKGTGADGILDVGFSTDGTRPTSGNKFVQITTGNNTAQCNRIGLGLNTGNSSHTVIFDKVRVDDAQIGDNPP